MVATEDKKIVLEITKDDLVDLGITSHSIIVAVLSRLNAAVKDDPTLNTREHLISLVSYNI